MNGEVPTALPRVLLVGLTSGGDMACTTRARGRKDAALSGATLQNARTMVAVARLTDADCRRLNAEARAAGIPFFDAVARRTKARVWFDALSEADRERLERLAARRGRGRPREHSRAEVAAKTRTRVRKQREADDVAWVAARLEREYRTEYDAGTSTKYATRPLGRAAPEQEAALSAIRETWESWLRRRPRVRSRFQARDPNSREVAVYFVRRADGTVTIAGDTFRRGVARWLAEHLPPFSPALREMLTTEAATLRMRLE